MIYAWLTPLVKTRYYNQDNLHRPGAVRMGPYALIYGVGSKGWALIHIDLDETYLLLVPPGDCPPWWA